MLLIGDDKSVTLLFNPYLILIPDSMFFANNIFKLFLLSIEIFLMFMMLLFSSKISKPKLLLMNFIIAF